MPHSAAPRACDPRLRANSSIAPATTPAPPSACTQRPAISTDTAGASAHTNEPAANAATPTPHTRTARAALGRAATTAAGSTASASTMLNDVSTHATPDTVVS